MLRHCSTPEHSAAPNPRTDTRASLGRPGRDVLHLANLETATADARLCNRLILAPSRPPCSCDDVRDAVVRARHQLPHENASTNLDAQLGVGRPSHDLLEHGPPRRNGLEALVPVARCPIRDEGGHQTQRIESQPAGRPERRQYVRQLLLEHDAATGL